MKELTLIDDYNGSETALLCERHFRKIKKYVGENDKLGIIITVRDTNQRGCRHCRAGKAGYSPWSGPMFKLWRVIKAGENE